MKSACHGTDRVERPIWQAVDLAGNVDAFPSHAGKRCDRDYGRVEQDVLRSSFFGEVKPHATAAQSFVSSKLADSVLRRIAIILEGLSYNYTHSNVLPGRGHSGAQGKLCNVARRLQSEKRVHQYSYGSLVSFYLNAALQTAGFSSVGCALIHTDEREAL